MAKNIPGLEYRNIEKVVESLGVSSKKKVDGQDAVTEAMLCGFAYIELMEMQKNGLLGLIKDEQERNEDA